MKKPDASEDEAADAAASWPKMAQAAIVSDDCLPFRGPECGACEGSCPIPDTLIFQREKPQINQDSCAGCGLCLAACIADPKAIKISSLYSNN